MESRDAATPSTSSHDGPEQRVGRVQSVRLPVLGIATCFETNTREVMDLIEATFGAWRSESAANIADGSAPLHVRVMSTDGSERTSTRAPVRYYCPDRTRVFLHTPGSLAVCDPDRRESIAYVTRDLVRDREHFRVTVLEALTLALLCQFDRHPIHAAAIARDGRALLLAAPSGTGKSTLAYVAHGAGFTVLSDDHVWVQLTPAMRVWGWRPRVHLPLSSVATFPETQGNATVTSPDGDVKLSVDLEDNPRGGATRTFADDVRVCVLGRGPSQPSLERLSPGELARELTVELTSGFDRFPDRHEKVVRALAARGGWRLTLSNDPREALPLLKRALDAG